MNRFKITIIGLALIFSAVSNNAFAKTHVFCRKDQVQSNISKTWCNWSPSIEVACNTEGAQGTINNQYLLNRQEGWCADYEHRWVRWTEPSNTPEAKAMPKDGKEP